jgi:cytochrome c oxidase assembly protein Cox11
VAPYFSKVECFCFEEQRLLAGEEVDMPLFFFIDKDILDDPSARNVTDVVLSYTFFKYDLTLLYLARTFSLSLAGLGEMNKVIWYQMRHSMW